ncbi:MAG: hypothetical protein Q7S92_02825 [Candidatus Diapherotrites archaeon]|nr:hypothetical protein [Candidatus Diapherotrites archaeon]
MLKKLVLFSFLILLLGCTIPETNDNNGLNSADAESDLNLMNLNPANNSVDLNTGSTIPDIAKTNTEVFPDISNANFDENCILIKGEGNPLNKFNFLVIGAEYPEQSERIEYAEPTKYGGVYKIFGSFKEDLKAFRENVYQMQTNPIQIESTSFFSETKNLMNFYAMKTNLNVFNEGNWCCNEPVLLQEIKNNCSIPVDFVMIMRAVPSKLHSTLPPIHAKINGNLMALYSPGIDFQENGQPSSSNTFSISTNIDRHEFGHAFIGMNHFLDSSSQSFSPPTNPNYIATYRTDIDVSGCPKWCSGELNTSAVCYPVYEGFASCLNDWSALVDWSSDEKQNMSEDVALSCWETWNEKSNSELGYGLASCDLGTNCMQGTGCFFTHDNVYTWRQNLSDAMGGININATNSTLSAQELFAMYGSYTLGKMKEKVNTIIQYHQTTGNGYFFSLFLD